ncbi:hypothetical protein V0288_09250 [Pannus brasiliensis CCIBt3594]|uniref:Uncharacterized protein n=1 Tax=Pannus brasiliensis CCIBt3594 TaxID=1427578 RepID=A0AAW9QWE1_9CHRO
MNITYIVTAEKDSPFHKQLQWLLDEYGQEWSGENDSQGLNWWASRSGHPAEEAEEMTKKLRLACVERSIGETVVKEIPQ